MRTEVRCPNCDRFLFNAGGFAPIEIVCPRCGATVIWPSQQPELKAGPTRERYKATAQK